MKKLFYILAAALMLLASTSCTKKMVPLYLKGTTWVYDGSDVLSVIKFNTRRTFDLDIYDHTDDEYSFTIKYRINEVKDDQVYFEFVSISIALGNLDDLSKEGMMTLLGKRDLEMVSTRNHWRDIMEDTRAHFNLDKNFSVSKYAKN